MAHIDFTVGLKDSKGKVWFYEEDCVIYFTHDLVDGEVEIEVYSFTNMFGAKFSANADNIAIRYIFLSVKEALQKDGGFYDDAYEEVADEYRYTGRGANDPDGRVVRRSV